LRDTATALREKFDTLIYSGKISEKSRIMFVNDGSKDKTWEIIETLNLENEYFTGISLSRNRGHQNALLAGLMIAKEVVFDLINEK
jgi:glycosyltransferase involved in cell wall biosynthesis